MSRYNPMRHELGRLFLGPFVAFFLMIWIVFAAALSLILPWEFDTIYFRPFCLLTGHSAAHQSKWGVEPVCLDCNARLDGGEDR